MEAENHAASIAVREMYIVLYLWIKSQLNPVI
jgi:hypothetical protein